MWPYPPRCINGNWGGGVSGVVGRFFGGWGWGGGGGNWPKRKKSPDYRCPEVGISEFMYCDIMRAASACTPSTFVCPECNKDCHSRIGLHSHSRRCALPPRYTIAFQDEDATTTNIMFLYCNYKQK